MDQAQEINVDHTECNVSLVPDKISNPVIWDLTLAQINEAKPWTRHSLEQVCSFPDPDLSLVVVGESGELPPTLISVSRDNAIAYLSKQKICSLDAPRMSAIYKVYQSMSYALTNSPDCDITKVKSYINTKNRKQVHKKLLAFIDHSSLVSNSIIV